MTDEELCRELWLQLDQEKNARERVRIEWRLSMVQTRVIQKVVAERFAAHACKRIAQEPCP